MEGQYRLKRKSLYAKHYKLELTLVFFNVLCLGIGMFMKSLEIVAALALLQMVSGIFVLIIRGYKLLSFPVIFYAVCYIFHGGYLFLILFKQRVGNLYMFRENLSGATQLLVGKFILLFFAFLLLGMRSKDNKKRFIKNNKSLLTFEQMKIIGTYVFFICLLPRLYVDLKFIFEFLATGIYKTTDSMNNYILILADGFYVGGIMMIIGNRKNSKKALTVLITCFIVLAISMISGNRGIKVAYFLALVVFYFSFVIRKKLKGSRLFAYVLLGYLFLVLIATFGDLRERGIFSISIFFNLFIRNASYKMLFDQLGEFGYAAFTLGATMETFGETGYLGGKIYLLSWLQVFPNIGGMLDGFGDSLNYVMMLPNKYQHALGGSLLGEYYANFGYLSFFFAYLLGVFIKKIYTKLEDSVTSDTISSFALIVIFAIPKSFIWIRSVFNEFPRSVIWYFVMILILKSVLYKKRCR